MITLVAVHCHTQQHSEYDEDSGRSSVWRNSRCETANAENLRGKIRLDLHCSAETASYLTNDSAWCTTPVKFDFPNDRLVNANPALGWWGLSECVGRDSFTSVKDSKWTSKHVCYAKVADWLRACETSNLSGWLSLNIHHFPSEKWSSWNRTNRTGGYGHVRWTTVVHLRSAIA